MPKMTAAEAVWYALAHLHRTQPSKDAFDGAEVVRTAYDLGFWDLARQTLRQHLSQWVNAQSPSESARAAYVVSLGRGGPYRLLRSGDAIDPNRQQLERHPDPGQDPTRRAAVDWYQNDFAKGTDTTTPPAELILVEAPTAVAVRRYAEVRGMNVITTATVLLQEALKVHREADPMLKIVGIAEGEEDGGKRHDEALYG